MKKKKENKQNKNSKTKTEKRRELATKKPNSVGYFIRGYTSEIRCTLCLYACGISVCVCAVVLHCCLRERYNIQNKHDYG